VRYCARLRDWVFALRKRVSLGFGRAPPAQIENRAQWTQLLSAQSTTIKAILNNHALPSVTYFDASTRKCPEPDAFNFANDETHNTVLIRCIERLAANLLNNGVQHNKPGGHIDVTTLTVEGHAILRVANSGAAIPADDLDRLFEPFQRIDGARTSTGDGLGLGLSIVQAIADAHGATIETTLPDNGGLSIEIAFPVP